MAGSWPGYVGNLAFDPESSKALFQQRFGLTIELADSDCRHAGRLNIRLTRVFHAREYIGGCPAFAEKMMRVQWSV